MDVFRAGRRTSLLLSSAFSLDSEVLISPPNPYSPLLVYTLSGLTVRARRLPSGQVPKVQHTRYARRRAIMTGDGPTTTSSPTKLAVGGGPPPSGAGGPASSSIGENGKEKQKEACVSCRVTKVRSLSTAKRGGRDYHSARCSTHSSGPSPQQHPSDVQQTSLTPLTRYISLPIHQVKCHAVSAEADPHDPCKRCVRLKLDCVCTSPPPCLSLFFTSKRVS